MRDRSKGNPRALLPIGVFLVIFLGAGILSGDFYTMPAIVGFLIALTVAFCQNRRLRFSDKLTIISKGGFPISLPSYLKGSEKKIL